MRKSLKLKGVFFLLIFSFLMFYSPYLINGKALAKGNLIGFVYDKDGTTPLEGAIVKLKNVSTSSIYESSKADKLGVFKIEGIDEGLYVVGISSKEGSFNVENFIGIKANETAKVSFSLEPQAQGEKANMPKMKKGNLISKFFTSPLGLAVIGAASVAVVYSAVELSGVDNNCPSAFKNKK